MEKYVIGLDSGTSGIKAVLFDQKGREIRKSGFPLTSVCKGDWYEECVDEIWEKAQNAIRNIMRETDPRQVTGIGITAQGDGLWLLDSEGNPVRNGCCFCDGRGAEQFKTWTEDGTANEVFRLSGTRIFTGNQPCIVKWMELHEKESLEKARYILHLKDVLFYKLTHRATTDVTDQSLIFLDMNTGEYSGSLYQAYGLEAYREKYPPVKKCLDNYCKIHGDIARSLGLSEDVIVSGGPMDVAACALGAGVMEEGACCSIMGTAALHEMVVKEPCADNIFAGMTVFHAPPDTWLRLMASLAGTPNLEWIFRLLGDGFREEARREGLNVYEYAERLVSDVPVGARGVIYHPYLLTGGERAPFTNPEASASFTGLSVQHTKADMLRAVYEGVAYAMYDCYQNMPYPIRSITVCGGGASSGMWCQMFADVLGKPVLTVKGGELGAKGAALTNMVIQGIYPDYRRAAEETVETDRTYEPDMEKHRIYKGFYELYRRTRQDLEESWELRRSLMETGSRA